MVWNHPHRWTTGNHVGHHPGSGRPRRAFVIHVQPSRIDGLVRNISRRYKLKHEQDSTGRSDGANNVVVHRFSTDCGLGGKPSREIPAEFTSSPLFVHKAIPVCWSEPCEAACWTVAGGCSMALGPDIRSLGALRLGGVGKLRWIVRPLTRLAAPHGKFVEYSRQATRPTRLRLEEIPR